MAHRSQKICRRNQPSHVPQNETIHIECLTPLSLNSNTQDLSVYRSRRSFRALPSRAISSLKSKHYGMQLVPSRGCGMCLRCQFVDELGGTRDRDAAPFISTPRCRVEPLNHQF